MRVRLALAGQRPINNLVDVSNFVMLETGQPLHFYDADRVKDAQLIVRDARDGEKLVTLDDVERTLTPQALVVADPTRSAWARRSYGRRKASEVGDATTAVLLEAANFNGARIRRSRKPWPAQRSASRHEKTLAPALTDTGAARAAQLLSARSDGLPAARFRQHVVPADPIRLRVADVKRLLGFEIPAQRVAAHLSALGCGVDLSHAGATRRLDVTPPWRRDVTIAADLVEEVARMEGYEREAGFLRCRRTRFRAVRSTAKTRRATLAAGLSRGHHSLHGRGR